MNAVVTIKPMYLAREEAAKFLAISTSTLENLVAIGEAPKPRKVSKGRAAWLVEELEAFGRARPTSDQLPAPDCGFGRAGKNPIAQPEPERRSRSR